VTGFGVCLSFLAAYEFSLPICNTNPDIALPTQ
jgi:hypothetical protein